MPLRNKKILITYGPTWTAIDRVRVISNISSGELGQRIIENLTKKGAIVTALEGPVTHTAPIRAQHTFKFRYFRELKELMRKHLEKKYDVIIHAAAVSDFQMKNAFPDKISSDKSRHTITLVPTEKLIDRIKKSSWPTLLVGFKLQTTKNIQTLKRKVQRLFSQAHCDLIVANTLDPEYKAYIFNKNMDILAQANSRFDTARLLVNILNQCL